MTVEDAEALWLLGEMAAALGHDLAQPINVVRLSAEGALDRLQRGNLDPARLQRSLENVCDQAQRLQEILDRLRRASRRPERPPQPLSPLETVRCALAELLPRLKAEHIRLRWHADPATPLVLGHAARLDRAVAGVLANACDAIAAASLFRPVQQGFAGTLAVTCRPAGPDAVKIAIEDDGPGLSAPLLDRLNRRSAPPPGGGIGIGLTVTLGVVAEMGGRVEADNSGTGARIAILLPAAPREREIAPQLGADADNIR